MAGFVIKFENVDFENACIVYFSTIAGELGYEDMVAESDPDPETRTMSCVASNLSRFCEIFPSLIVGLISDGCKEFVLEGSYGTDTKFFAQYKNDKLCVSKSNGSEQKEAEYQLENGLFGGDDDRDDGDEFSCFFDQEGPQEEDCFDVDEEDWEDWEDWDGGETITITKIGD